MVHGILDGMEEPKPAYNTVSTIVRILEKRVCLAQGLRQDLRVLPARNAGRVCAALHGWCVEELLRRFAQPPGILLSEQKAISLEETDAILRMLQNDTSQNDVKQ